MAIVEGMWTGRNVDGLIGRLEVRLEQYRIHADALSEKSRKRGEADELVRRIEQRLIGLRCWRAQQKLRK